MGSEKPETGIAAVFAAESASAARNRLYAARLGQSTEKSRLSELLSAVADAEDVQARRMLMHMRGKIGDPSAHLDALVRRKYAAYTTDYPKIADALANEGMKTAAEAFEQFGEVAKNHFDLIDEVASRRQPGPEAFYVCQVCGFIAAGEPPPKCPVCGAVKAKFKPTGAQKRR